MRLIPLCLISGNNLNKSKFYAERNEEQADVKECSLSFGPESSVFQSAIKKFKD